jgi:dTDP-4-dehydrorhamnose reductase
MAPGRPRVLVLGGTGMLGHVLWSECLRRFDALATVRSAAIPERAEAVLDPERTLTGVRVEDEGSVAEALERAAPEVVVNCIGLVKQRPEADDAAALVRANALFPHQLRAACAERGARLIQISTDCVFAGDRGGYTEDDRPDPADLYGRSKLAGEPCGDRVLTLRTSMLGRELGRASGLLEWFLSVRGEASGYPRAVFSGPTTPVLARLIGDLIERHPELDGIWHVGAEPISKFDLLTLVRDAFGLEVTLVPDPSVEVDRSLDGSRLRAATGWEAPGWYEMVDELANADR